MNNDLVLGVDIGGSHITAALVDLRSRSLVSDRLIRKRIDPFGDAEQIITNWCECLSDAFQSFDIAEKKIGIAMPGPFDYEKGVSLIQNQHKYDALYGFNVKELIAKKMKIASSKILMMNDAAAFLQGEIFANDLIQSSQVIGITLGTGLGSSIYTNQISTDADLWFTPFANGVAEDYLSTRWFIGRFREMTGKNVSDVKTMLASSDNQEEIKSIFGEFAQNLALFIRHFLKNHNAQAIVLGGNIAKAGSYFLNDLERILKNEKVELKIHRSQLNEEAALIGAASLWSK